MDFKFLLDPKSAQSDPLLDVPNLTTKLTKRQRLIVQKTWSDVCDLGKSTVAIELFDLFFKRNPSYVQLFKELRNIPFDCLKAHPKLKAHGVAVIHAISGVIENLEDTDAVVLILKKIGQDHIQRKIKPEHFEELKKTIMVLLGSVLKADFHPVVEESWDLALTVVMSVVKNTMNQAELKQK